LASFAHAGLAARRQAVEDLMAVDATIMTDGKLGCISEVDACLFAAQAVPQDHQWCEQARHQADETIRVRQIAEAGAMLLANPVMVECLEVLKRREVKQHHDKQHLGT
jgi:hypothetical protein